MQAARAQQPVGEDMPAFRVGAKLDLIHRNEIGADLQRHRLHRADPILGPFRHDALLSRHKRHHRGAALGHDAVIDLAREQAQRQADHPGPVCQHPLDGVVGLARVGRAEDRDDPRSIAHRRPARLS